MFVCSKWKREDFSVWNRNQFIKFVSKTRERNKILECLDLFGEDKPVKIDSSHETLSGSNCSRDRSIGKCLDLGWVCVNTHLINSEIQILDKCMPEARLLSFYL